jgi:ribosomal protein S18 acetylase RimI-like enzyme
MNQAATTICPLTAGHAAQVAALHQAGIHTGFLSSLGPRFLTQLYAAIPATAAGFGFVAESQGRVIGFIACAERLGAVYKQALRARGLRMALALFPAIFRWGVARRIVETLLYPSRLVDNYPAAEVLSVVVAPAARGLGAARDLMNQAFAEFRRRGIHQLKVQVWTENPAAKRYYEKCGFHLAGQMSHHENILDVYVISLQ